MEFQQSYINVDGISAEQSCINDDGISTELH